jgi:hypothetical protein
VYAGTPTFPDDFSLHFGKCGEQVQKKARDSDAARFGERGARFFLNKHIEEHGCGVPVFEPKSATNSQLDFVTRLRNKPPREASHVGEPVKRDRTGRESDPSPH